MLPPLDAIGLEPFDQSFPIPMVFRVAIDKALALSLLPASPPLDYPPSRQTSVDFSQTGVPEAPTPMQTAYSPTSLEANCGRTFLCSYHRLHNVIPECILIPASHILFLRIIFNLHSFVFCSHVCYYVLCNIAIYVHSHR
jgi:hypothetical protein